MSLLIIAVNKQTYQLVRRAVSAEVRNLENFYLMKSRKVNKKPFEESIMQRTLKEIKLLQDFAIELERRYDFR